MKFSYNLIDLKEENIINDIKNITGKTLSAKDFIYGRNSALESIEFVQIIAFVEDEYIAHQDIDLLYEFSLEYNEIDIKGFCSFIKKWI